MTRLTLTGEDGHEGDNTEINECSRLDIPIRRGGGKAEMEVCNPGVTPMLKWWGCSLYLLGVKMWYLYLLE